MADKAAIVHMSENSPEQVAYKLMQDISHAERVSLHHTENRDYKTADRKWILDTFAECLMATKQPSDRVAAYR